MSRRGQYINGADFLEIAKISRNPGGTEHAETVCTMLFLSEDLEGVKLRVQLDEEVIPADMELLLAIRVTCKALLTPRNASLHCTVRENCIGTVFL